MYNLVWRGKTPDEDHVSNTYDTWREMQEVAGEMIDDGLDKNYYIVHFMKDKIVGTYNLKDFVARTQPNNFTLDMDTTAKNIKAGLSKGLKPGKDLERERFHHLDDKETAEVLKYTPTGALIGELARRSEEYESAIKSIDGILANMKVYDIKH